MSGFQPMEQISFELAAAIEEEAGVWLSVNVFEWEGKAIHIKESFKIYDVEVNLFNRHGKRIDSWTTDIIWSNGISETERRQIAFREAEQVRKKLSRWVFRQRKQIRLLDRVTLYSSREELDYNAKHGRNRLQFSEKC